MQRFQAQGQQAAQAVRTREDSSDEEAGEDGRPERSAAPKRRFAPSAAQAS